MNKPLADLAARRAALDPTRSFIVEAAAGSGKTALLTQRFLVLLARVAAPEEVVAITFTRKAAAEMRGRVLAALNLAEAPIEASEIGRTLQELARAVLAHDVACGWRLHENPQRLRILTIDALSGGLVRRLPLQAGLAPGSRLREDSRELYHRAARRTLLTAEDDPAGEFARATRALLTDLDNDWRKLESLLVEMLARRDQWLLLSTVVPARATLEAARATLIAAAQTQMVANCPERLKISLIEIVRWIGQSVAGRTPDSPLAALAHFTANADEREGWRQVAEVLLTKAGRARRNPAKEFSPGPEADGAAWKRDYQALVGAMDAAPTWIAALAATRGLPALHYSDGEFARVCNLLMVLRLAVAHWQVVSAEQGVIDFPDQTLAALTALGELENPTDLALAMDYQLSHLLVDEFQDTSRIQYTLLERLIGGWTDSEARTLFLVGDPLQSIYRFRDADVNLFTKTLARRQFGNLPLHPLRLNANFRTCPAVLDWLNETFTTTFAVADSELPPFHPFQAIRDDDALSGVQIHLATAHSVAAQMLEIIQTTWLTQPAATIAILVRSRTHLGTIPQQLAAAGIPLATNDIDALSEIPLINDLMALTRALFDLTDRVAWLAVLRAPWCGLSLADLHTLAGSDRDALLWDQLHDAAVLANLAASESARVQRVRAVLARALAARGRVPYAQLVEDAWRWLVGSVGVAREDDERYARRFFEMLESLEIDEEALHAPTLRRVVAEQFAPFPRHPGPTVEIMTIHHAKGLEFDVVLVPELQRAVRADARPLLLAQAALPGREELPVIAALSGGEQGATALYEHLRGNAKIATKAEGYRLLYVALTRARSGLHVFCNASPESPRPSGSFLSMLWPALAASITNLVAPVAAPLATPVRPLRKRLRMTDLPVPIEAIESFVPRVPLPFEWASPLAKPIGTVTHAFLQWMASAAGLAGDLPAAQDVRARLRRLGLGGAEVALATREVQAALAATVASARGQWLFSPTHRDPHSEYRIATVSDGQVLDVIIDRTFVTSDGVRWIVDFKTSTHEGSDRAAFMASEVARYRPQLAAYARAFAKLERRPVMLGLYYPRLDAWREWPGPAAGDGG